MIYAKKISETNSVQIIYTKIIIYFNFTQYILKYEFQQIF